MKSFADKIAVVTGGGSGMGRELVIQLAAEGCSVAACDLAEAAVAETVELAAAGAPAGIRLTAHGCDVSDPKSVDGFRDEVVAQHDTDHVNLLFNNAAIFGAGSFLTDDREAWERVFNVCWAGVYNCCRAFVPLLVASDEGHLVNTSSINVLRAVHGPGAPSTAYSASKFAVKGFTEALIEDFRTHAPHVGVSLVLPGGVGTDIRANSGRILRAHDAQAKVTSGTEHFRAYLAGMGVPLGGVSDQTLERLMDVMQSPVFAMPPPEATKGILDGIRAGQWRILVGVGARELDDAVRVDPDRLYDPDGPSVINRDLLVGVMTLLAHYAPGTGTGGAGEYELHVDSSPLTVRVGGGTAEITRGAAAAPDAVIRTDPPTFRALITKQQQLDDALGAGRVELSGDRQKVAALLDAIAVQ